MIENEKQLEITKARLSDFEYALSLIQDLDDPLSKIVKDSYTSQIEEFKNDITIYELKYKLK